MISTRSFGPWLVGPFFGGTCSEVEFHGGVHAVSELLPSPEPQSERDWEELGRPQWPHFLSALLTRQGRVSVFSYMYWLFTPHPLRMFALFISPFVDLV